MLLRRLMSQGHPAQLQSGPFLSDREPNHATFGKDCEPHVLVAVVVVVVVVVVAVVVVVVAVVVVGVAVVLLLVGSLLRWIRRP